MPPTGDGEGANGNEGKGPQQIDSEGGLLAPLEAGRWRGRQQVWEGNGPPRTVTRQRTRRGLGRDEGEPEEMAWQLGAGQATSLPRASRDRQVVCRCGAALLISASAVHFSFSFHCVF